MQNAIQLPMTYFQNFFFRQTIIYCFEAQLMHLLCLWIFGYEDVNAMLAAIEHRSHDKISLLARRSPICNVSLKFVAVFVVISKLFCVHCFGVALLALFSIQLHSRYSSRACFVTTETHLNFLNVRRLAAILATAYSYCFQQNFSQ